MDIKVGDHVRAARSFVALVQPDKEHFLVYLGPEKVPLQYPLETVFRVVTLHGIQLADGPRGIFTDDVTIQALQPDDAPECVTQRIMLEKLPES